MKKNIILSIILLSVILVILSFTFISKNKVSTQKTVEEKQNAVKTYDMNSWKNEIPSTCKSFFDGCNSCSRVEGDDQNAACTMMFCEKYQKPKCLDN